MSLDRVGSGVNPPKNINVIIEIPSHSDPVKYEIDKETGALFVDRFMNTAMFYPCNYGYVPHTLSNDNDPIDALVISPYSLISGSVIKCRPVGMLRMADESGEDSKIIAVPHDKIYRNVKDLKDVPELLLEQIAHFFDNYKSLERKKWVNIEGWVNIDEAEDEIMVGVHRFNNTYS